MTFAEEREMHVARERMRKETREEAESILRLAGFTWDRQWELANGYWPDAPTYDGVRRPWWLFSTSVGLIQLGWRKGVLAIDWEATGIKHVVTQDDVTRSETMVHAWGVEKAIEYLRALRMAAPSARDVSP